MNTVRRLGGAARRPTGRAILAKHRSRAGRRLPLLSVTATVLLLAGGSLVRAEEAADVETGRRLFLVYCAECHGESGDGYGMRQDISYTRPRSFQSARFKLATTENRVPSDRDLLRSIAGGMPGSGMPNWAHLPAAQIQSLVLYVRKLGVDAVRRELDADVAAGQRSRTEADAILAARTVPGPPVAVPPEPPADAASLVRGRVLYVEACAACHGEHGSPPFGAVHVDFDGNRLPATSLRAGMFKGGSEGEQLYVRILKGMDGTAMPAYEDVYSPTDVWHLVHHVLELATRSNEASLAAPDPVPTAASSTGTPTAAPARDSAPRTSPRGGDETDQEVRLLDRWLTVVAVLAGVALLALLLALAIGSAR